VRCWEISPTSERIVQDILDFPNVFVKVIEVGGTVLPECKLRHGHRALRHDKKSFLKIKLSTRQRIESNKEKPIYPDALRGRIEFVFLTTHIGSQEPSSISIDNIYPLVV